MKVLSWCFSGGGTPVLIPNTEVKPSIAEGTAQVGDQVGANLKHLILLKKLRNNVAFLLCYYNNYVKHPMFDICGFSMKTFITSGNYYHVFNRGVSKQTLFYDNADYARFLFLLLFLQSPVSFPQIGRSAGNFLKKGDFATNYKVTGILGNYTLGGIKTTWVKIRIPSNYIDFLFVDSTEYYVSLAGVKKA